MVRMEGGTQGQGWIPSGANRRQLETTGEATILSRETLTSRDKKKRQESGSESRAEAWGAKVVPVRTTEG